MVMSRSEVKVRKGQLIHTFGPGAMVVNKNGISLMTGGLQFWYTKNATYEKLNDNELDAYKINDDRLAKKLNVKYFLSPPDAYINTSGYKTLTPIPGIRFPYWHICSNPSCQALQWISPVSESEETCKFCKKETSKVYQSRFIAACPDGHIQDFPWVEWLNAHSKIKCCGSDQCELELSGTDKVASSEIKIKCKSCNTDYVYLSNIFKFENKNGEITSELQKKGISCKGHKPWVGFHETESCSKPLIAVLRQSNNVYYAKTDSSIRLSTDEINNIPIAEIEEAIGNLNSKMKRFIEIAKGDALVDAYYLALQEVFPKDSIKAYFEIKNNSGVNNELSDNSENFYRYQEYNCFKRQVIQAYLKTEPINMDRFSDIFRSFFSIVTKVNEVVITNAFYGFDRIISRGDRNIEEYKNQLIKTGTKVEWLPANETYGEGIFLEFREDAIQEWASRFSSLAKFKSLAEKKEASVFFDKIEEFSPEFLLVHTFSHILINQLILECGYSTASLRERIYVSKKYNMYGVLIYTAAGDSEGSLGGLVRMADPFILENIVKKSILATSWCSSDPICSELGEIGGQGMDGLNLAACHNCCLLPETSCEWMNLLLDRSTMVSEENDMGYFNEVLNKMVAN